MATTETPLHDALKKHGITALRKHTRRTLKECAELVRAETADKKLPSVSTWRSWESRSRPINLDQLNAIRRAFKLSNRSWQAIVKWWWDSDEEEDLAQEPAPEGSS